MTQLLRKTIHTKAQMTDLRDTVRNVLTPSKTAELLSQIVTDPKINEVLQKAVGRKGNDLMKSRVADTLVSEMLGFPNMHEMFDFYNNQRFFRLENYTYEHQYGTDTLNVYVEEGVSLSVLDAMVFFDIDFEHDHPENNFDCLFVEDEAVEYSALKDDQLYLKNDSPISGVSFELSSLDMSCFDGLPDLTDELSEHWINCVEEFVANAGSGSNFSGINDKALRDLSRRDIDAFAIEQGELTSLGSLLRALLFDAPSVNVSEISDIVDKAGFIQQAGQEIHYDLTKCVALIIKDKRPIYASGIYSIADARGKKLRELLEIS